MKSQVLLMKLIFLSLLLTAAPTLAAELNVNSLRELQQALGQARPDDVVVLVKGSSIDLKSDMLLVPEKVTLRGEEAVIHSLPVGEKASIVLRPGARLTGLRLVGPNPLFKDIDAHPSTPSGFAVSCADAEVDHCEIAQFQRGGIAMFRDSNKAHIHHNQLHDIAAYPILLGNGTGDGHIIEHNRIEWAWHAIGSNGSRGSGYTARHNEFIRMPRPMLFDVGGASPPNWCLDVHENKGAETKPPRPSTRLLVVHDNVFLAHADVKVGDGSELLITKGLYPKHDIYIGRCPGVTNKVDIHHNRFLMHEKTGSKDKFMPFGRAVRICGLHGNPGIQDDPLPTEGQWEVSLRDNTFSGK